MANENWYGVERRKTDRRKSVRLRRLLVAWIIVFSLAVCYAIIQNRHNTNEAKSLLHENSARIDEIKASKAALTALQHTNCGLLKFLLVARKARWEQYTNKGHPSDLQAVEGYEKLAHPFLVDSAATGFCPLPKKILISKRPLTTKGG